MKTWLPLGLLVACLTVGCGSSESDSDSDPGPSGSAGSSSQSRGDELFDEFFGGRDPSFGTVNRDQLVRIVDFEEDGPFYMLNLIRFREKAEYADGRETTLTGREADDLYAPLEFLVEIGAEIVFVAQVETVLPLGDGTAWEQIGIVRYPSRSKFVELMQNEEFQARAVHKDAGVAESIVMVSHLADSLLPDGFEPATPAFPPTAEDPPFDMVHLLHYHDQAQYEPGSQEDPRSGREAMELYSSNAGSVAAPLGVYPTAWFDIEGVFIGDGRDWDEFRINRFPSHATFGALTSDTSWMSGTHHRTAALEDTYSLMTLPLLNTFAR